MSERYVGRAFLLCFLALKALGLTDEGVEVAEEAVHVLIYRVLSQQEKERHEYQPPQTLYNAQDHNGDHEKRPRCVPPAEEVRVEAAAYVLEEEALLLALIRVRV